jgi:phosphoketolase
MSAWIEIKNQEDVQLSEDGRTIEVLYEENEFGNCYIEIPIEIIKNILPHEN